jgi:hypothetical protein
VISTLYRDGCHVATQPKAFIPIINHLKALHNKGFVHGDIRAYNTVLQYSKTDDKEEPKGWLIDFDFGGKAGQAKYPIGYVTSLNDGRCPLVCYEGSLILKWHDWYAIGQLIFSIHRWQPPNAVDTENLRFSWWNKFWHPFRERPLINQYGKLSQMWRFWECIVKDPSADDIETLKQFLRDMDKQGWTLRTEEDFDDVETVTRIIQC